MMMATFAVASAVALLAGGEHASWPWQRHRLGTDGPDDFGGGYRSDIMNGGSGNDFMNGDPGADQIVGGTTGDAFLLDEEVKGGDYDVLVGGSGNDVLYPRNDPAGGPRPDLVQRRDGRRVPRHG
jgi:hypothetical protein